MGVLFGLEFLWERRELFPEDRSVCIRAAESKAAAKKKKKGRAKKIKPPGRGRKRRYPPAGQTPPALLPQG